MLLPNRGWTLIETLVACCVVALLLGFALPVYNDHITRSRLAEAVSLATAAKLALGEACSGAYLNGANNSSLGLPGPSAYDSLKLVGSVDATGIDPTHARVKVSLKAVGAIRAGDAVLLDGTCNPASGIVWSVSGSRAELTKLLE